MGCRITKGVTEQCTVRLRLTKAHLKNTKHCVLITVLLHHLYLKFQYDIKREKEKKALKFNKHNQFNHTPEMIKSINLFIIL